MKQNWEFAYKFKIFQFWIKPFQMFLKVRSDLLIRDSGVQPSASVFKRPFTHTVLVFLRPQTHFMYAEVNLTLPLSQ